MFVAVMGSAYHHVGHLGSGARWRTRVATYYHNHHTAAPFCQMPPRGAAWRQVLYLSPEDASRRIPRYRSILRSPPSLQFRLPQSTKPAQVTFSLVTLALINPGGNSSDIMQFSPPNLDTLSVAGYSEEGAEFTLPTKPRPVSAARLPSKHVVCNEED